MDTNADNPRLPSALAARAKAASKRLVGSIAIMDHRANACWEIEIDHLYRLAAEIQAILEQKPAK